MFADDSRLATPAPALDPAPVSAPASRPLDDPARLAAEVRALACQIHGLLEIDEEFSPAGWLSEAATLSRRLDRLQAQVRQQGHRPLAQWLQGVRAQLDDRRCALGRAPVSV